MKLASALLFVSIAAACGGEPEASSDAAELAPAPTAFALQFTGSYLGAGAFTRLVLHPDGGWTGQRGGRSLRGRYLASTPRALPLTFQLTGAATLRCEVAAYDGRLQCGREALRLQRPATSDEDLCASTGGRWTDDDPDPATGLYCVCGAGLAFLPAAGGCARLPATAP